MPKKRVPKKTPAKKAAPKRGVGKNPTPRKGKVSQAEVNRRRLERDISYYESQNPVNLRRRTKSSEHHKTGVPLENLYFDARDNRWYSADREISISEREYDQIAINYKAVPSYTPVHDDRNRIIAYRNSITGEQVSKHYRTNIFGKFFRNVTTERDVERARAYQASLEQQKKSRRARHYNLVDSFGLRNPQFREQYPKSWRYKIATDPTFKALVLEMESIHNQIEYIDSERFEALLAEAEGYPSKDIIEAQATRIREELAKNPRYAELLVELGRRLPSDDQPPGTSDPGHIKNVVRPYYEALFGSEDFEEGEG